MTMALDMSLDELIKHNKSVGRGGGGRGGRGNNSRGRRRAFIPQAYGGYGAKMGGGPSRRQMYRASFRQNPYATAAKASKRASHLFMIYVWANAKPRVIGTVLM